ncbi:MAG: serine/threonine protein kinase [Polyangiaceae bacterium]|nr:serine/threonine protein kinase [Polyangiaceae bacterium]
MLSDRAREARRGPATPRALEPGILVGGKYDLIRRLGRGGMAEGWLATHSPLKTEVAVKFLSGDLAEDSTLVAEASARFRFEAQVSARLGPRSRHIVTVHDADVHEGRPYLVMELVQGKDLGRLLEAEGPLSPALVADLLDQIAGALEAAHGFGILHRDLKPSNLLLTSGPGGQPAVKVADFGVAKALACDVPLDDPKATRQGSLIGSPPYMSPEQILGDRDLDARTDLWALGVVAYELLTGRLPFSAGTIVTLAAAVTKGAFTPPSEIRPDLPRALDRWFSRALQPARASRFASAPEMAAAFRAALEGRPRRRAAAFAAIGIVAIIAGGVVIALLAARGAATAPAAAPVPVSAPVSVSAPAPVSVSAPAPVSVSAPAPVSVPVSAPGSDPAPAPVSASAGQATSQRAVPAPPAGNATGAPDRARPAPGAPSRPPRSFDPSDIQ